MIPTVTTCTAAPAAWHPRMAGNLKVVRYAGSTMARTVLDWNPRSSEGAVTATGQSLIDLGLLERVSRR